MERIKKSSQWIGIEFSGEHLPSMPDALGSIPSPRKPNQTKVSTQEGAKQGVYSRQHG